MALDSEENLEVLTGICGGERGLEEWFWQAGGVGRN